MSYVCEGAQSLIYTQSYVHTQVQNSYALTQVRTKNYQDTWNIDKDHSYTHKHTYIYTSHRNT
jgi:hypothetical protein